MKRHGRRGYFWSDRFKSVSVEKGKTLINCLAYIDLNPVRAGIVEKPEDYRWSSLGYHIQTGNKKKADHRVAGVRFRHLSAVQAFIPVPAREKTESSERIGRDVFVEAAVNRLFHKQSALGYALLVYMTIVVAVVTLIPFEFEVPSHIQISFTGNASDIFTNILLFIPLGFLFQPAHGRGGWKPLLLALCFGTAVSCAVEAGQLFLPSRYSSLIDVAANGFGAWLGAAIAACQQVRVRQNRMPGLFGLELPLLTSVYLLMPLMWLGGISLMGEIHRLGLMLLVGVFGGCGGFGDGY